MLVPSLRQFVPEYFRQESTSVAIHTHERIVTRVHDAARQKTAESAAALFQLTCPVETEINSLPQSDFAAIQFQQCKKQHRKQQIHLSES